jgi:hypothetical protein
MKLMVCVNAGERALPKMPSLASARYSHLLISSGKRSEKTLYYGVKSVGRGKIFKRRSKIREGFLRDGECVVGSAKISDGSPEW